MIMNKKIEKVLVTLEVTYENNKNIDDAWNIALNLAIRPNFNTIDDGVKLLEVEEYSIEQVPNPF